MFLFEIIGKAEAGNNMSESVQDLRKWKKCVRHSRHRMFDLGTYGGYKAVYPRSDILLPTLERLVMPGANRGPFTHGVVQKRMKCVKINTA